MKIKKTLTFNEAWKLLDEDFTSNIISKLEDDPDYVKADSEFSFKDTLIKLRNEFLTAKTDEEQDAAIETLRQKLTNLLNGLDWKIIIELAPHKYMVMSGNSFTLDLLVSVLEPDANIVFASLLVRVGDDDI